MDPSRPQQGWPQDTAYTHGPCCNHNRSCCAVVWLLLAAALAIDPVAFVLETDGSAKRPAINTDALGGLMEEDESRAAAAAADVYIPVNQPPKVKNAAGLSSSSSRWLLAASAAAVVALSTML